MAARVAHDRRAPFSLLNGGAPQDCEESVGRAHGPTMHVCTASGNLDRPAHSRKAVGPSGGCADRLMDCEPPRARQLKACRHAGAAESKDGARLAVRAFAVRRCRDDRHVVAMPNNNRAVASPLDTQRQVAPLSHNLERAVIVVVGGFRLDRIDLALLTRTLAVGGPPTHTRETVGAIKAYAVRAMPDSVASSQMALCLPNLSQTSASGLAHLVAHAEAAGTISTHCLPLTATGHLDVAANPFWDATDLKGAWAMAVRGRETQPPSSASVAVGWFDAVAVRRSCFDQGIDALAITCLGVLSGLDTIKIITAYRLSDRTTISMMPDDPVHMCAPVYQCMPGWSVDMGDCRTFNDLPKTARDFIGAVQEATGYRVRWVLTGSDPHHAIAVPPVAVTDD